MSNDVDGRASGVVSRRGLIGGGAVLGALAAFSAPPITAAAGSPPLLRSANGSRRPGGAGSSALGFAAVPPSVDDDVVVPDGYVAQVLIPWGDPIQPGGPAFQFDGTNTAAEQAQQFGRATTGWRSSRMSRNRGLLVRQPRGLDSTRIAVPDGAGLLRPRDGAARPRTPTASACASSSCRGGAWRVVRSRFARRITANTEMELTGPAAGHPLLQTAADPTGRRVLGTFNNCANGADAVEHLPHVRGELQRLLRLRRAPFTPTPLMSRYGVSRPATNPW